MWNEHLVYVLYICHVQHVCTVFTRVTAENVIYEVEHNLIKQ